MRGFLKDLLNVPNTMSLLRLVAAPSLMFFWFFMDMPVTALIVGTVAGVTDLFDGIIARKLNQVTDIGALIDQLGDLVFESICLLIGVLIGELWSGLLVIYLFREFTVTVVRSYMYSHGGKLPSSQLGRAKSSLLQYAFFLLFLGAILLKPGVVPAEWFMCGLNPGRVLIWMSTASLVSGIAVGIISGTVYLRAFARFYTEKMAESRGEDAPA